MTVTELIAKLQALDGDLRVYVDGDSAAVSVDEYGAGTEGDVRWVVIT